ncbi:hypothetical protein DFH06DRAFT_1487179 [Mycena polygramma]|nr:hypothetical protein DFH06DRAFT_1487179 [Mycena polygramma]
MAAQNSLGRRSRVDQLALGRHTIADHCSIILGLETWRLGVLDHERMGMNIMILIAAELREPERIQANYWLDIDIGKYDDVDDSDYVPSEQGSASEEYTSDSDQETSSVVSDKGNISESELAYIQADEHTAYRPPSPTPSQKALEEQENLDDQLAELVKAEEAAAAAYDPDQVVSLITEFYELLITMGHFPEGSLRYAPHTNPPVDEALAVQLGYEPAVVSLMLRLPYFNGNVGNPDICWLIESTYFADYTCQRDLKFGRRPYPYPGRKGCPDIDSWLLPIMLPNRDGWNVMLDTRLGVVRACCTDFDPSFNTTEWRWYVEDKLGRTDYRRAPLVPAARYFSELIYAYRSLSRLPAIHPDNNDPKERPYTRQGRDEQEALLSLYRECGWPDEWRRAEFVAKWEVQKKEIDARWRPRLRVQA